MKKFIIAAAVSALSITGFAQVKVSVHETAKDQPVIPAEIYGQFSEHLGRCIYDGIWVGKDSSIPNIDGYRKDLVKALQDLKVPVLRWPGGCLAVEYHWMEGIGPVEQRTKVLNSNWGGTIEDNSFGTHEFLNLCELINTQPYISGNVGSGTVEELAKWVEYMTADKGTMAELRAKNGRKEPWKVKYLGIGNESWGCGGNMTPEFYADLFRRYAVYCREFNGNELYKVASGSSEDDYDWTRTLMQKATGKEMDGLSLHFYTCKGWNGSKGPALNFTLEEYKNTLGRAYRIDQIVKNHAAIMDIYDPKKTVGLLLDEWGTWFDVEPGTNPGHLYQQNSMRDAMVAALNFDIFHKYTRRLKMCNIAQVVNVLQSMILTNETDMVLTPTYHVFEMYNVHQNAEYLATECDTPLAKGSFRGVPVPEIDATASRKDGKIHFDLVNTSLKGSKTVLVTFDNAQTIKKIASARILTSKNVQDHNDFDSKNVVAPKAFSDYKLTKKGVEVTLPPCSIVAFEAE